MLLFSLASLAMSGCHGTPDPGGDARRADVEEPRGIWRAGSFRLPLSPAPAGLTDEHERSFRIYTLVEGERLEMASQLELIRNVRRDSADLVLTPAFPLEAGTRYEVRWSPASEELARLGGPPETLEVFRELPEREPTTIVETVYPTSDVLPENHLKFYLHFSSPMTQGQAYHHLRLLREDGTEVPRPFLELGEELWDFRGVRFTLFFDPGRVKRELLPRETAGPALEEGATYRLVIDRAWEDAKGLPLKESHVKTFTVGPPDYRSPELESWEISVPRAGTRDPLIVRSPEPLDRALFARLVEVHTPGYRLGPVETRITDQERTLKLIPWRPWRPGVHRLVVRSTLEDLAGNSLARPFEVDLFEEVREEVEVFEEVREFTVPEAAPETGSGVEEPPSGGIEAGDSTSRR